MEMIYLKLRVAALEAFIEKKFGLKFEDPATIGIPAPAEPVSPAPTEAPKAE